MKEITVAVDEETHRRLCIRAKEAGISVSTLVAKYLHSLTRDENGEAASEHLTRTLDEVHASLRARGSTFSAADRLPREELYDRTARRQEEEQARLEPVMDKRQLR